MKKLLVLLFFLTASIPVFAANPITIWPVLGNNMPALGLSTNGSYQEMFRINGSNQLSVDLNQKGVVFNGATTFNSTLRAGGAFADSLQYAAPTAGATVTINNGVDNLILKPAATIASANVYLPQTPVNGQIVRILSTQIITTLTLAVYPASGQTLNGAATTIAAANTSLAYIYRLADTSWYRLY